MKFLVALFVGLAQLGAVLGDSKPYNPFYFYQPGAAGLVVNAPVSPLYGAYYGVNPLYPNHYTVVPNVGSQVDLTEDVTTYGSMSALSRLIKRKAGRTLKFDEHLQW